MASTMQAIEDVGAGWLAPPGAMEVISAISIAPPASTRRFSLAAAAGAVALAVLFGVQHLSSAALIFVSAWAGAILRRSLARYSANIFLQPFGAALLAGVFGALTVRCQMSSSLRLIAVCPCMVLAPGPHVLNGIDRSQNAFGLLISLNMLVETPGGFDYTGANCMSWMKEAGFRETPVEHLSGPDSMVMGIK